MSRFMTICLTECHEFRLGYRTIEFMSMIIVCFSHQTNTISTREKYQIKNDFMPTNTLIALDIDIHLIYAVYSANIEQPHIEIIS